MDEADGTRSQDEDARGGLDGQAGVGAQAARQGLGQGQKGWVDLAGGGRDARQGVLGYADDAGESAVHAGAEEGHVRADVGASRGAGGAVAAGDFGGEAHLGSRGGHVGARAQAGADAPHARGDLVSQDDAGGHPVRLLSRHDAQVGAAQGRGLNGEEDLALAQGGNRPSVQGEGAGGGQ